MKLYYLANNGEFSPINKPFKAISESVFNDERPNVSEVSFTSESPSGFIKNQLFKLVTKRQTRYYIAADISESNISKPTLTGLTNSTVTTVKLVDAVNILDQFIVQSCCFSAGSYTLDQLITRLLDLAKADILFELPKVTTFNPYFEWKSASLKNCLLEVANSLDKVLKIKYNEINARFVLYFESKGGDGIITPLADLNGKNAVNEAVAANLAKEVYSEVVNVESSVTREPSHAFGSAMEATNEAAEITNDNAGVKLKNKIREIGLIRIFGYLDKEGGTGESVFNFSFDINNTATLTELLYIPSSSPNSPFTEKTFNHPIKLLNKQAFDGLESEEAKRGVIYWEEDKIYLDHFLPKYKFRGGVQPGNYNNDFFLTKYSIERPNPNEHETFNLLSGRFDTLKLCRIEVTYYPVLNNALPIKIRNNSNLEGSTFYNQTSNNVNYNKFGRVLSSYVESMQAKDLLRSKNYLPNEYNNILLPGDFVIGDNSRFVVTSATYTYYEDYVGAVYQLNENHIAKYENATPDTTIRISAPPLDDYVQRTIHEMEVVDVSLGEPLAKHALPAHITRNGLKVFLDIWQSVNFPTFTHVTRFYGKNKNERLNRYASTSDTVIIDNAFITQLRCESNVLFTTTSKDGIILPYQYVNEQGVNNVIDFQVLGGNYISQSNPYFSQFLEDYPFLNENWDFDSDTLIYYLGYNVNKDFKEQLSFTYELFYNGVNNTIVNNDFVNFVIFENPTSLNIYAFDYYINKYELLDPTKPPLYNAPVKRFNYDVTTNSQQLLDDGEDSNDYANVKSLVLAVGNKPLLIRNLTKPITKLKGLKICYNAHNLQGKRTGVVRKEN